MPLWPIATDIPSPRLVAAWFVLEILPVERVPLWAAHWMLTGHDGPHLVELAGLHGDDPFDVRDLLAAALVECGVRAADLDGPECAVRRSAVMTAYTSIAEFCVRGLVEEFQVFGAVFEIAGPAVFASTGPFVDPPVTDPPLGRIIELDDDRGAGWSHSEHELRAAVRRACAEQLRAAHVEDRPFRRGRRLLYELLGARSRRSP